MDEHKPDTSERLIRFGCGALLGALVALSTGLWAASELAGGTGVAVAGCALVFGWLAMRFGDRFWSWIRSWWL